MPAFLRPAPLDPDCDARCNEPCAPVIPFADLVDETGGVRSTAVLKEGTRRGVALERCEVNRWLCVQCIERASDKDAITDQF